MKIGILTHYYGSNNYGGVLQAYALTEFLRMNGNDAEQICYQFDSTPFEGGFSQDAKTEKKGFQNILEHIFNIISGSVQDRKTQKIIGKYQLYKQKYLPTRNTNFESFRKKIPHSEMKYDRETIGEASKYDCYITGSDQVWNFQWYNPAFFLEFVGASKRKIAYAASAGKAIFNKKESEYIKKTLADFYAISVREKDLGISLEKMFERKVSVTVDPVFLLSENQWNKASSGRIIQEKYIFCYYLGWDKNLTTLSKKFAKAYGFQIVTIPYVNSWYSFGEEFGDQRINSAGPEDFIALIRDAEYVLTDSFHATAFSVIFGKQFYVFDRKGQKGMNSRICTLLEYFNCLDRMCDAEEKKTIEYMMSLPLIEYDDNKTAFNQICFNSKKFLLDAVDESNGDFEWN